MGEDMTKKEKAANISAAFSTKSIIRTSLFQAEARIPNIIQEAMQQ